MKLSEIKQVGFDTDFLVEGVIPAHITLTLEQVVKAGQITNNVQTFTIAGLVNMFKNGGPVRWPRDLNSYSMSTSSDLINAVRSLTNEEVVGLASWLGVELQRPAGFESNPFPCCNPQMDTTEWMRWVLRRQD